MAVDDHGLEVLKKAGTDLTGAKTNYAIQVVDASSLVTSPYDNGVVTYPNSTTEVYTFKLASTTVAVITLVYVDSTKARLSTWTLT